MTEIGIAGICGRKKVKTTRRDPDAQPAVDLVERDFSADAPTELWLTDVTYIPTDEGWLYLCSILDVFSRHLVGWSIADHLRTELCTDALEAAVLRRGRSDFAGTVLHSDHGCQYTSDDVRPALPSSSHRSVDGNRRHKLRQLHDGKRLVFIEA